MTSTFGDLLNIKPDPDVPEGWVGIETEGGEIVYFDLGWIAIKPRWDFLQAGVDQSVMQAISKAVNDKMKRERKFVEDRICAGYDRVVIQSGDKRYVYEVPSWLHQFEARCRVQWRRWKYPKKKEE